MSKRQLRKLARKIRDAVIDGEWKSAETDGWCDHRKFRTSEWETHGKNRMRLLPETHDVMQHMHDRTWWFWRGNEKHRQLLNAMYSPEIYLGDKRFRLIIAYAPSKFTYMVIVTCDGEIKYPGGIYTKNSLFSLFSWETKVVHHFIENGTYNMKLNDRDFYLKQVPSLDPVELENIIITDDSLAKNIEKAYEKSVLQKAAAYITGID